MRNSEFNLYGFQVEEPHYKLTEKVQERVCSLLITASTIYDWMKDYLEKIEYAQYSQVRTNVIDVDFKRRKKRGYL